MFLCPQGGDEVSKKPGEALYGDTWLSRRRQQCDDLLIAHTLQEQLRLILKEDSGGHSGDGMREWGMDDKGLRRRERIRGRECGRRGLTLMIFFLLAALSVPARLSSVFCTLSSAKRRPNVVVTLPSACASPKRRISSTNKPTSWSTAAVVAILRHEEGKGLKQEERRLDEEMGEEDAI
jgi:hypothetical protein